MPFWTYMLHCRDGLFYVGHTDDLDRRIGEHKSGLIAGFAAEHLPVELVWSDELRTRDEAKEAERKLKGWSRAKKLALIRGDWERISALAKSKGSASTSSARTGEGDKVPHQTARPELVEGPHFSLQPHSQTSPLAVRGVEVEIARSEFSELVVVFTAKHEPEAIRIPAPLRYSDRRDGLWETTCFEVFIQKSGRPGYYEFNLAPSTAWAGYEFVSYREKKGDLPIDRPHFDVDLGRDFLRVTVAISLDGVEELDPRHAWQVALSAVIEETDGTKSYWALAHPPGKPDFHHPACFAATLPAPDAP